MPSPVECCGKPRKSRFCPDCGKALAAAPIEELLAHLRKYEKNSATYAMTLRRRAVGAAKPEAWSRDIARADEKVERWRSWADALAALLTGQSVAESEES